MPWPQDQFTESLEADKMRSESYLKEIDGMIKRHPNDKSFKIIKKQSQERLNTINAELERRKNLPL